MALCLSKWNQSRGKILRMMDGTSQKPQADAATILLVDDDESVRGLLCDALERSGYRVLEARFTSDALVIGRRHDGPIHVMIADVMMPGINGRELADMFAAARPQMKVLYISGYPLEVVREKLRRPDMAAFLQKPVASDALLRKVRELLEAEPPSA
jgi:two-component system, cell cycle sensor histidine kinase and response regulator CckA